MNFPTINVDPPKREKINLFKIRKVWCFKYFFDDKEIFNELYNYYKQ